MQSLWLIIIVFFIVVLVIPLFIKAYLSFDIINNLGALSFYILNIKILSLKIMYKNKNIVLYSLNKKTNIPIELS